MSKPKRYRAVCGTMVNEVFHPLAGDILNEIRRRKGLTLRAFCLKRGLDPARYSMIERNFLYPTMEEMEHYFSLVGPDPKKAIKGAK